MEYGERRSAPAYRRPVPVAQCGALEPRRRHIADRRRFGDGRPGNVAAGPGPIRRVAGIGRSWRGTCAGRLDPRHIRGRYGAIAQHADWRWSDGCGFRPVAISKDGRWLASGATDGRIIVADVKQAEVVARLPKRPLWPNGLAFSPDGKRLYSVTGSWDPADQPAAGKLTAWTMLPAQGETGFQVDELNTVEAHTATADDVAVTADGRWLVTSASDSRLKVWDAETLKLLATIAAPAPLHRLHLFGDPPLVAAGDAAGNVMVWDLTTTDLVARYAGHEGHVYDVAATPDGRLLISAGEDDSLLFWPGPRQGPDEELLQFVREVGQPAP